MVRAFIVLQLLDLLTTAIGLRLGAAEVNPLGFNGVTLAMKATIIVIVAIIIRRGRIRCGVPLVLISAMAVVWNILNIVAELLEKMW